MLQVTHCLVGKFHFRFPSPRKRGEGQGEGQPDFTCIVPDKTDA